MARGFSRTGGGRVSMRPVRTYRVQPIRRAPTLLRRWPIRPFGPRPGYRPIRSGRLYRVLWPAAFPIVVIPELADQIAAVLEEFARTAGSTSEGPLKIVLRRGTMGLHNSDRAIDIYEVGGKAIGQWAREWNTAMRKAAGAKDPAERTRILDAEKARNLGYKLYKTLQARGGWAQPAGYPVQLFGPWTRSEGPHKGISDKLLKMHTDHIHVAK